MKPYNARPNSFRKPPFKRSSTKPIVNYQPKGFTSDSDSKNSPKVAENNSFSTLNSGSDEENRKEWYKVKIMFEGMLLKDSENQPQREAKKFQDAQEKSGPNPKKISMPWFV